ncbi:MAG: type II toxin-antitoxin system RelE/ParE family toxin [Oscillospiraceae bacterium]|jgi:mRNA interferase RelE/StbE|nr:type II toxin-antitoxin system RelE/ParE family toxin [Oscillospiraceae bacterium]
MYILRFSPSAARYLKKIKEKNLSAAYKSALRLLAETPYLGTPKTGDLSGIYGYDIYYNKTNYELAYRIYEESGQTVLVILAGTRENFYDTLKRYIKTAE